MSQDLKQLIEQISRDKGLSKDILIDTMQEAISLAAKRKYGFNDNFEVSYNDDVGEFEVFRFHEVVEEVLDPQTQISLADAQRLDPEVCVEEELGVKLDTKDFGRIAAQVAKQVIFQRMKEAEKRMIYDEYIGLVGKIITGINMRIEKDGNLIINLGRTEALLPASEQIPRETHYHRGDRLRAMVIDVRLETRGPQVVVSRTHPDFLTALFEAEVPEITEGIVRIVGVSREAGSRSKIAVATNDPEIDPVGACVGLRGSRVQGVVQELKGEKIDIIPYSLDVAHYVASALAPAVVIRVVVDEEARLLEVVVPDDQLSLAIGRKGQNVRLASRLVGWRIDVKNETKYQRTLKDGYQSLLRLPGLGEVTADLLFEAGYGSARDLTRVSPDQISMVDGITEDKAQAIWNAANEYVSHLAREDEAEALREAMAKEFFTSKSENKSSEKSVPSEEEAAADSAAESAAESPEDSAAESPEEYPEEYPEDSTEDSPEDSTADSFADSTEDSTADSTEDSVAESAEDTALDSTKDNAKNKRAAKELSGKTRGKKLSPPTFQDFSTPDFSEEFEKEEEEEFFDSIPQGYAKSPSPKDES